MFIFAEPSAASLSTSGSSRASQTPDRSRSRSPAFSGEFGELSPAKNHSPILSGDKLLLYELSQQEKQLDEEMSSGREASTSRVSRKDSFVIPKLPPNEFVFEGPPARTGYSDSSMSPARASRRSSRRRVYSRRSSSSSSTSSRRSTRRKRRFRSKSRSVVRYDSEVYSHHNEDIQRAEIPVAIPAPIPAAAGAAPVIEENEERILGPRGLIVLH